MLPAHSFAALQQASMPAARRHAALVAVAAGLLAGAAALGGWLPSHALSLGLLGALGLGFALGLLGLRRKKPADQASVSAAAATFTLFAGEKTAPTPTVSAASVARPLLPRRREPVGEIRCNPFFELLSSSSL